MEDEEIIIEIVITPLRLLLLILIVLVAVGGFFLYQWYEESRPIIDVRVLTMNPRVGDMLVVEVGRLKGDGGVVVQLLGNGETLLYRASLLEEGETKRFTVQLPWPGNYTLLVIADGRVYSEELRIEG